MPNQTYEWRMDEHGKVVEVYRCRCGQIHEGDYAVYDYGHHMCFHDNPLLDVGLGQVACPQCGLYWRVEKTASSDA